tara:strand:+ start:114 stop:1475 length:1362 start_codon:yes stop_codon:yes gene_type:complete
MKKFILILIAPLLSFGQYSTYYGTYNVNVNSTVNSTVRKTITTIDYGQLELANAQREKNRIERLKIEDEKDRRQRLEIAMDPSKAFDYGTKKTHSYSRSALESIKLKSLKFNYIIPHKELFFSGGGVGFNNISENNIETRIQVIPSYTPFSKIAESMLQDYPGKNEEYIIKIFDGEEFVKQVMSEYKVGKLRSDTAAYLPKKYIHKTELTRVNLCNNDAYVLTVVWEDDYDKGIDELYYATVFDRKYDGENYILHTKVQYRASKIDEVSFEEIEGRRYYFRRLIKKLFSGLSMDYEPMYTYNKEKLTLTDFPRNQIGFIFSPTSANETRSFYGLNFFNFFTPRYGFYYDIRFNTNSEAHIMNGGLAVAIASNNNYGLVGYLGYGYSRFALRSGYDSQSSDYDALWDNKPNQNVYNNINFGLIIQTGGILSYQIGYDSSVPTSAKLNVGIGWTF